MSEELKVAIEAAREAAKIALEYYKTADRGGISIKEDNSPVTKADIEAEEIIKQTILDSFPNSEFISEESEDTTKDFKNVWIIDPIDGTKEYSNGIDLWGILIAYALNSEILLGVAYFPAIDVMVYAERGKGAFLNGKKITVSKTDDLRIAFMGYSPIKFFTDIELKKLLLCIKSAGPSRNYSTSFSGYCLATGKMDLFISSMYNKIWDIAPFICIVKEAGGKITDWGGKELSIRTGSAGVVVSNGILHEEVMSVLRNE